MQPTEWTLSMNKEKITIQAVKLTLFQQCKLIECKGSNDLHYLLFFYKDDYITVQPLVEFEQASFLDQAPKNGYHLHAPSPLFSKLLPPLSSLKISPFNQLLSTLKKRYSTEEIALILSYFDSYIPAEKLDAVLKDFFFTYRRNGKLMAAYRFATILLSRGYNQNWLTSTLKHPDYVHAAKLYETPLSQLLSTDPIYVEQQCFSDLTTGYNLLVALYEKQNRSIDAIIIQTTKWLDHPSASTYPTMVQALIRHLKKEDVLKFLQSLLPYVSPKSGLHNDVYQRLLKQNDYKTAVDLLFTYSFPLSDAETNELPNLLEHVSTSTLDLSLNLISDRLFPLFKQQPLKLEEIVRSALPQLLQHHSLADIHKWMKELQYHTELPSMKKINEMVDLIDDSDRQLELGIHYYDLLQYEKAIECFNWEMELQPTRVEPVQWLAKAYRKVGKLEEVETYHSLLTQMQRSS